MDKSKRYKDNVMKNYFYTLFTSIDLTRGIWMIYIATKGISLVQLGILEAIFHITSFLMEIPTGMVADVLGRKASRVFGRVFNIAATIIMIYSNSFYMFAMAFIICALSYNLESGAGTALIYDSLKVIGKEEEFIKVNGKIEMVYQVASVIALALGGYLASLDYMYAYISTLIFTVIALLISLKFEEVVIECEVKAKGEKNPFRIFISQLKDSTDAFMKNKKIGLLMVFAEIIAAFCTTLFFYLQNHWIGNGLSEFHIGIIFAVSSLICAFTGIMAHKIENILKERGVLLYLPIIFTLCMGGVAFTSFNYIFFILMNIIEGIIFIVIGHYVNKMIPSEVRATILSFQSMIFSFFMIFIFPLIGKLGDAISLDFAFKCMFVILIVATGFNSYILLSAKNKEDISKEYTI